ncbi:MAG TPA: adenylyltransferase/cytidyltransferase family protein [Candidatus Sumerlaeota bacterium]|nr:adenylyltransferase/cytidyltransferase family protein [Candidatus Sumerlaeota bacterium]
MTPHGFIFHDRDALKRYCADKRAAGLKVVFTNGVFDLFHVGHLDSLRRARAQGDVLVVGLNSDASVKRLKGEGRPILPLDQRMRLMAAFEMVNAVASFDEDTPARIIEDVAPDVLVKGGHYQIHEIVGHEFVQARGGIVLSLPLVDQRSSSLIVDRIKKGLGADA